MVTYDWRLCPTEIVAPAGVPSDYGPLASDVGPRTFDEFPPSPDVLLEGCPQSNSWVWLAAGALVGWVMKGKK